MASITGKDAVVTIGGSSVNGKLVECTLEETGENARGTAAGDTYVERVATFRDWKFTAKFRALDQAAWDLLASLVNTTAAFTMKRKSSDTNSYAAGTGLFTGHSLPIQAGDNSFIEFTITIECNGTGITYDTTPAS